MTTRCDDGLGKQLTKTPNERHLKRNEEDRPLRAANSDVAALFHPLAPHVYSERKKRTRWNVPFPAFADGTRRWIDTDPTRP